MSRILAASLLAEARPVSLLDEMDAFAREDSKRMRAALEAELRRIDSIQMKPRSRGASRLALEGEP
jgi:hypothetical protein